LWCHGKVSLPGNICGCPETVTDLPLVSEASGAERHDKRAMTDLFRELLAFDRREREATITANTKQQGLRRYGLNGFTSPTQYPADRTTFTELACEEIDKIKSQLHKSEAISPLPTSLITELQSSSPMGGDDTQ